MILSVFTYPKLRKKCNVFIVNLAIADACVSFEVQAANFAGKFSSYPEGIIANEVDINAVM